MTTRAKFVVTEKTDTLTNGSQIKLMAVTEGSPEDKDFFKWTPSGQITLGTVNEPAAAEFILGKKYYVDFKLAESV